MFSEESHKFMFAALQEAEVAAEEDEVPIGAIIIYKNRIIGRGYNQVEKLKDPTAHAEMIAITAAANYLNNRRLNDCELYVTLEPCIMCTGALLASRVKSVYFSTFDSRYGACGSIYNLAEEGKYNHQIKIFSGLYAPESERILKDFFNKIRKN